MVAGPKPLMFGAFFFGVVSGLVFSEFAQSDAMAAVDFHRRIPPIVTDRLVYSTDLSVGLNTLSSN